MTGHNDAASALAAALDSWDRDYGHNEIRIVRHIGDYILTDGQLRTILAELAEARRQNDEATTRIADLEAQLDTASARHCGLTAEVEGATARMVELEDERDDARRQTDEASAEVDRLWHFIDTNDRLHDVITGAPDHYIVNGDHSGCNCGTDWKPPPVRVEWGVRSDAVNRPDRTSRCDDEEHARRRVRNWVRHHPGTVAVRRLVGEWTEAEDTSSKEQT